MERPNRNANTISGVQEEIEPVAWIPQIASEPWPFCHTSAITPQAAAMLRVLSTIAFAGNSIERNARASSTNVVIAISATISGKLP
jgi:hypothetical protein